MSAEARKSGRSHGGWEKRLDGKWREQKHVCARISTGTDSHGLGIDLNVATVSSVRSDFTGGKSCNYCPLAIEY